MTVLKKAPPRDYKLPIWIWRANDSWIFSQHPYEPIKPFYAAAGWHIDAAKNQYLWFTGIPERLIDFQEIDCPDDFKNAKMRDPKARRQIEDSVKKKLDKPVYGSSEVMRKGEAIAQYRKELKENMLVQSDGTKTFVKKEVPHYRRCYATQKIKYSEINAQVEAERYNSIAKREELAAYKCTQCGQWHIGHPLGWVKNGLMDKSSIA